MEDVDLDFNLDDGSVRTVQSIDRGFTILEAIARSDRPLALAEISRRIGLHTSTTFHILRTLSVLGCIKQDKDRKYRIGSYIYSLAVGATSEINLVAESMEHLERLGNATLEASHIAVLHGDDVIIVARYESQSSVKVVERVGSARPAYCTALGKALLSGWRDDRIRGYLQRTALKSFTPKTIVDPEQILAGIIETRQTGAAYDDSEYNVDVRCIAAPVRNYTGRVVAAIGISGPLWRLSLQQLAGATEEVSAAASSMSKELGFAETLSPNVT